MISYILSEKDKQALLEEFERKKKARQINVSTDDHEVKKRLRQLNEPICLFGEGPANRRIRLRELLSMLGDNAAKKEDEESRKVMSSSQQVQQDSTQTWYHEGSEALRTARLWIADYSLPRAKDRLDEVKNIQDIPSATKASRIVELQKKIQALAQQCSQVGDNRPVSSCSFNKDATLLLTGSWSGLCKVWSIPNCELVQTLRGHQHHIGGVAFRNNVQANCFNEVSMASSSNDGIVKLWGFNNEESIADISGHAPHRVAKLAFHPSGRFLGTACYDASWRLWDLQQKQEVLHQEGHSKAVHAIAFQIDGSVALTGGLDAFGRVWDLRTGRCIMFLEGHLGNIYAVDFSPNGYHMITGSEDNSCKIWDLRRRQTLYTIPAHTNIVTDVKYQKNGGNFVVSASYDGSIKVCLILCLFHKFYYVLKFSSSLDS
jgi:U4/U6 small nuclear ribonucleoprotein PRP4